MRAWKRLDNARPRCSKWEFKIDGFTASKSANDHQLLLHQTSQTIPWPGKRALSTE